MKFNTLPSRFNWRFCLVHFFAMYCLIDAFHYLHYFRYADFIWEYRSADINSITSAQEISYFILSDSIMPQAGLLIAFIISIVLAIRKKIWWVNSLVIFIITGILEHFSLLGWQYTNIIFVYTVGWINKLHWVRGYAPYYAVNMVLLLAGSLLLFFLKRTNRFISSGFKGKATALPVS
ncbi:MAG: hypothetical protein V4581_19400 [Bacteroidota bacterium]